MDKDVSFHRIFYWDYQGNDSSKWFWEIKYASPYTVHPNVFEFFKYFEETNIYFLSEGISIVMRITFKEYVHTIVNSHYILLGVTVTLMMHKLTPELPMSSAHCTPSVDSMTREVKSWGEKML